MQIFLSRPTWIEDRFAPALNDFLTTLDNLGITPRTLGTTDYPSQVPLDEVIGIMEACQGAIILGYPQISIEAGSIKQSPITNQFSMATEWNHIEAALAYSGQIPLLMVHHNDVSRGVFDRGVMNAFVHSMDLSERSWHLDAGFNGALTNWKENCRDGLPNFSNTTALNQRLRGGVWKKDGSGESIVFITDTDLEYRRLTEPTAKIEKYNLSGAGELTIYWRNEGSHDAKCRLSSNGREFFEPAGSSVNVWRKTWG